MIEAVNSVISNAPVNRAAVETQTTARSLSANPEKTQEVAKTPYVSPYISIDRQYNRAVLQIRDSDTGDVVRQFPTEGQLKAYRAAQEFSERQKAQAENQVREATTGVSAPSVDSSVELPSVSEVSAPQAPGVETEA
jgi:uncharacterized FlaG/YvyC family protein